MALPFCQTRPDTDALNGKMCDKNDDGLLWKATRWKNLVNGLIYTFDPLSRKRKWPCSTFNPKGRRLKFDPPVQEEDGLNSFRVAWNIMAKSGKFSSSANMFGPRWIKGWPRLTTNNIESVHQRKPTKRKTLKQCPKKILDNYTVDWQFIRESRSLYRVPWITLRTRCDAMGCEFSRSI